MKRRGQMRQIYLEEENNLQSEPKGMFDEYTAKISQSPSIDVPSISGKPMVSQDSPFSLVIPKARGNT